MANPIILKELLQSAHRRRTFVVRGLLVSIIFIVTLLGLLKLFAAARYDWREAAESIKPLFRGTAWTGFAILPILALALGYGAIEEERAKRTMDLLYMSNLTPWRVIYGKFVAVVGHALADGIAVVPIFGLWAYVGAIPKETILGAMLITASTVTLLAAFGLLLGAMGGAPRRDLFGIWFLLINLYALAAGVLLLKQPAALMAPAAGLIPPIAFYQCVEGVAKTGTIALAVIEPLAMSGVLICLAALLYRNRLTPFRAELPTSAARTRYSRPRLKDRDDPLFWLAYSYSLARLRRRAIWLAAAALAAVIFIPMLKGQIPELSAVTRPWIMYIGGAWAMALIGIFAAIHALGTFSGEKSRSTVEDLMLFSRTPSAHFASRQSAMLYALLWPLIGVAAIWFIGAVSINPDESRGNVIQLLVSVPMALGILCLPWFSWVAPLVFSAASPTPRRAIIGFMTALALCAAPDLLLIFYGFGRGSVAPSCCCLLPMMCLGGAVYMLRNISVWHTWTLIVLLILSVVGGRWIIGIPVAIMRAGPLEGHPALNVLAPLATPVVVGLIWQGLGLRIFDRCMLGEWPGMRYVPPEDQTG